MAATYRVPIPSFSQDLITHSNRVTDAKPTPVKPSSARVLCRVFAAVCVCVRPSPAKIYESVEVREGNTILAGDSGVKVGRKTLVLDLDETLVHSSLEPMTAPDVVFSVLVENTEIPIYVSLRPGLHHLLKSAKLHYDIIIYTASLSKYADPLIDIIDSTGLVDSRLFREDCQVVDGLYAKDLLRFGNDLAKVVIVDVRVNTELTERVPTAQGKCSPDQFVRWG